MAHFLRTLAGVALFAFAGQNAFAQTAEPPTGQDARASSSVDDVVVYGGAIPDRARQFVQEVSRAPFGRSLARWNGPICIGVANLQPRAAQGLIDRIATVATSLGMTPAGPGCKPQILIVAAHADDAGALVAKLIKEEEYEFRPSRGGTDLGSEALRTFENSRAPVRWWHVSLPVIAETGQPAMMLDGDAPEPPGLTEDVNDDTDVAYVTVVPSLSRTTSSVRNDLMRAVIVVDVDQTSSVSFAALADYLAMVSLAQVDPSVDVRSADSILNLFNVGGPNPTKMTEWDAAFLIALYDSQDNPVSPAQQQNELRRRVSRVISEAN